MVFILHIKGTESVKISLWVAHSQTVNEGLNMLANLSIYTFKLTTTWASDVLFIVYTLQTKKQNYTQLFNNDINCSYNSEISCLHNFHSVMTSRMRYATAY